MLDELGLDADQIERQVTVRDSRPDFGESFTGMETLRQRIESTAGQYHLYDDVNDLSVLAPTATRLLREADRLRSVLTAIASLLEHYDAVVNMYMEMSILENSLSGTAPRVCTAFSSSMKALAMLDERCLRGAIRPRIPPSRQYGGLQRDGLIECPMRGYRVSNDASDVAHHVAPIVEHHTGERRLVHDGTGGPSRGLSSECEKRKTWI